MLEGDCTSEYRFLGEPVHKLKARDRAELSKRYIGFVFQQYHLRDNSTVYENREIPLRVATFAAANVDEPVDAKS
jgi:ABC-type lipoprotein export system ATPase subunit